MKELLIGICNCLTHPYIISNLFILLLIITYPTIIEGILNQEKKD